jgi:hypothetical protein
MNSRENDIIAYIILKYKKGDKPYIMWPFYHILSAYYVKNMNPDPLVRGMDLRIRIHPKMSCHVFSNLLIPARD